MLLPVGVGIVPPRGTRRTDNAPNKQKTTTMKKLFVLMFGMAVALGGQLAFAQTTKPSLGAAKPAATPKVKVEKPMPMHAVVDSIDATAKSFTQKTKDGKMIKYMVTDKTEIKNGDKVAKFEDIKVGDNVHGMRLKKSDTEYEVTKITKFEPEAMKPTK